MGMARRSRLSAEVFPHDRRNRHRRYAVTSIKYLCPFRSPTGEIREVVVTLSDNEVGDVLRHRALGRGAGAPGGPLEKGYAWRHAVQEVPVDFMPLFEQAHLVQ